MDRITTSTHRPPPRYTSSKPVDLSRYPLRHHRRPVYILIAYLLLLLVPWVCLCIVNQRTTSEPLGILMQYDLDQYRRWMRVASFLSSVAAVIALPCVAALLAYGAVVYTQRRSHRQSLNFRQLLALSDGRWAAVLISGEKSSYLVLGAGLLLLAAIQLPLQSILMPMSARVVYPCDTPKSLIKWDRTCDGDAHRAQRVGKEPEPAMLREANDVPHILDIVRTQMTNITSADIQENLWRDGDSHRSFVTGSEQRWDDSFWASAMHADTTTGPLRQHSMRLNSTSNCQVASRAAFPSDCETFSSTLEGFGIVIKACMPAADAKHVVERSSLPPRQRQDIEEVLYIDAQISPEAAQADDFIKDAIENVTIKCVAKTTRAFFELGNLHTQLRPSGIVDKWPTNAEMEAKYHDYDWLGSLITRDWEEGWDRDQYAGWTSLQGPLKTTAEALFGDGSYPQAVLDFLNQTFPDNQIPENADRETIHKACTLDPPLRAWQLPYNSHNDELDSWYPSIYNGCTLKKLPKSLFRMAQGLRHLTVAQSSLGIGMYLSNVAVLQDAANSDAARTIYNLAGTNFVAPQDSLGATIVLSLLIGVQAILLVMLVCYIYSLPTWTGTLDGFAMARLGAHLSHTMELPPLGHVSQEEMKKFDQVDGLIGIVPGPAASIEDDVELGTSSSFHTTRRVAGSSHQYEMVRPASPASTVMTMDLPAAPPQTRRVPDNTLPGMSASDFSSYLQGGGLTSPSTPSISSVASSVRSASPPPPYLPANSSATRNQRTRMPYELGLGAPGLITKAFWRKHQPK